MGFPLSSRTLNGRREFTLIDSENLRAPPISLVLSRNDVCLIHGHDCMQCVINLAVLHFDVKRVRSQLWIG